MGVEGQGFGLASHLRGVETLHLDSDKRFKDLQIYKRQPNFVNLKLRLGREQIGVDGRRKEKSLFNLSLEEIKNIPEFGTLNYENFLPHSLLKKR